MNKNRNKKIIVIGAHGFLGTHALINAINNGHEVLGIDRPYNNFRSEKTRSSLVDKKINIKEVEYVNAEILKEIIENFNADIVMHLGGGTKRDTASKAWTSCTESNVLLMSYVIAAIMDIDEPNRPVLVTPGSQLEYGKAKMPWTENKRGLPVTPYGASKLATTELLLAAFRSNNIKGSIVRYPLAFGPGQMPVMFVPELICSLQQGKDIPLTSGEQLRRFIFAEDAVNFMIKIAEEILAGKKIPTLINGVSCKPDSILNVAKSIKNQYPESNGKLLVNALPQRESELMEAWPDTNLAEKLNLIKIKSFENGIKKTVEWYKNNSWFVDSITL